MAAWLNDGQIGIVCPRGIVTMFEAVLCVLRSQYGLRVSDEVLLMAVWLKGENQTREEQFVLCPYEALPNFSAAITDIERWCESPERPGLWFWFYSGGDHRYHLCFSDAALAVECRIRWG